MMFAVAKGLLTVTAGPLRGGHGIFSIELTRNGHEELCHMHSEILEAQQASAGKCLLKYLASHIASRMTVPS